MQFVHAHAVAALSLAAAGLGLYAYTSAAAFYEYQRTDDTSSTFRGRNGSAGIVSFTAAAGGEPETDNLVDQHGTEVTFYGFDGNAAPAQIWKIVDAGGNAALVGDATTASRAISSRNTAQGRTSKAFDASDRRF